MRRRGDEGNAQVHPSRRHTPCRLKALTSPPSTSKKRKSSLSRVLLPLPLAPTIAQLLPAGHRGVLIGHPQTRSHPAIQSPSDHAQAHAYIRQSPSDLADTHNIWPLRIYLLALSVKHPRAEGCQGDTQNCADIRPRQHAHVTNAMEYQHTSLNRPGKLHNISTGPTPPSALTSHP